jgi:hypothetical protein
MARVATVWEAEDMLNEFLADLHSIGASAHMLVQPIHGKCSTMENLTENDVLNKCTMMLIPYVKPLGDCEDDE